MPELAGSDSSYPTLLSFRGESFSYTREMEMTSKNSPSDKTYKLSVLPPSPHAFQGITLLLLVQKAHMNEISDKTESYICDIICK